MKIKKIESKRNESKLFSMENENDSSVADTLASDNITFPTTNEQSTTTAAVTDETSTTTAATETGGGIVVCRDVEPKTN